MCVTPYKICDNSHGRFLTDELGIKLLLPVHALLHLKQTSTKPLILGKPWIYERLVIECQKAFAEESVNTVVTLSWTKRHSTSKDNQPSTRFTS